MYGNVGTGKTFYPLLRRRSLQKGIETDSSEQPRYVNRLSEAKRRHSIRLYEEDLQSGTSDCDEWGLRTFG